MSILSAIKAQSGTLTDLAKLPQALIMQMAQKGQIAQDMVMPILSKKAEMVEAARAMQNAQQQGGVPPTTVLEQIMQQNAAAEQPAPERGIETLDTGRMNPEQYAGGGIVSFEHGGEVPSYAGRSGSFVSRSEKDFPKYKDNTEAIIQILEQELRDETAKLNDPTDSISANEFRRTAPGNIESLNRELAKHELILGKKKVAEKKAGLGTLPGENVIPYAGATGVLPPPKKKYEQVVPGSDAIYDADGNLLSGTRPEGPSTAVGISDYLVPGLVEKKRAAEAAARAKKASELPVETGASVDAAIASLRKDNNRVPFNAEDRNKPGLASKPYPTNIDRTKLEEDPYLTGKKQPDERLTMTDIVNENVAVSKPAPITDKLLELPDYVPTPITKQVQKTSEEILARQQAARAAAGYTNEANEKKLEDIRAEREALPEEERQNKWMALAETGLAIAAGDSPYALQNIAKGGMKGAEAYKTYGKEIKEKKRLLREREDRLADLKQAERLRDADAIVAAQDKVDAANQQIDIANNEMTNKVAGKVFDATKEMRMEMYKEAALNARDIAKAENALRLQQITDTAHMRRSTADNIAAQIRAETMYTSSPKKTGELTRDSILDAFGKLDPYQVKKQYPNGIVEYARSIGFDWNANKMIGGGSASPGGAVAGTYDPNKKTYTPAQ